MNIYKDLYIVQGLLRDTERGNLIWRKNARGACFVNFGKEKIGIHVEIERVQSKPIAQTVIRFSSSDLGEVRVIEPVPKWLFSKRHGSEEDQELAEEIRHLLVVVVDQIAKQQLKDMETEDVRKQEIFQRLLSGV